MALKLHTTAKTFELIGSTKSIKAHALMMSDEIKVNLISWPTLEFN